MAVSHPDGVEGREVARLPREHLVEPPQGARQLGFGSVSLGEAHRRPGKVHQAKAETALKEGREFVQD